MSLTDKLKEDLMSPENIIDTAYAVQDMVEPVYTGHWWKFNRKVVAYKCKHDGETLQLGMPALEHYIRYHYKLIENIVDLSGGEK